ncbi:ER degradation-enhancing alpha-mannosidase-like protein 2 [Nowakowskiella sp. JEL0407]|nr:ER degradation-enhancing alpha-mannosidase-like protein 2 [Nowakowskiella sp. JEL0407]
MRAKFFFATFVALCGLFFITSVASNSSPQLKQSRTNRMNLYKSKVKEMLYHGFNSYLKYAYPKDELRSVSCSGVDTIGNFSLTLIDALDTFAVMDDMKSFWALVELIKYVDIHKNVNVSVFETNIRMIGGLLSAHIIAINDKNKPVKYDNHLLKLAEEIGYLLMPAFDTPTGLPYGSINLRSGVNDGESPLVCTACAGTFSIEFSWLSILTGNPLFETTARGANRALWKYRSSLDLWGNHIDVNNGSWAYYDCSIGGGVDSFYEYLLKSYISFSNEAEYQEMFIRAYRAIKIYMRKPPWHVDVDMSTGKTMFPYLHSLGAFWPGVKILAGDVKEAVEELNAIITLMQKGNLMFLPECLNLAAADFIEGRTGYPLRPELLESLLYAYRATKNFKFVEFGMEMVDRLQSITRTDCGFANVQDVPTLALEDKMESFFLAETLKYLYLLFDPSNKYNSEKYVFNTEAHPFPVNPTYFSSDLHKNSTVPHEFQVDEYLPSVPWDDSDIYTQYAGDENDMVVQGFLKKICIKQNIFNIA